MLTSIPAPPAVAAQPEPVAQAREHRFDVDLMRLVGSATVIFAHTSATFIHATDDDRANGPGAYWVGHIGDSVSSFAVPLFFAIAGWAVLVGAPPRDEPRMWARVVRNSVPLFVWSLAYVAWAWLRDRNEDPTSDLAAQAFFGETRPAYHLWFMYAYIPIVAVLALVVLVRKGRHPWRLGLALLGVAAGPTVFATVAEVTGFDGLPEFGWSFGTYQVVYAVGGALLIGLPYRVSRRLRWALAATMLVSLAAVVWYDTTIHYPIPNAHVFVGVATICAITLLNRIPVPERWRPTLSRLAGAALGAYMVHVFFVEELVDPLVSADLSAPLAALLLLVMLTVTLALSYGTSLLWGRLGLRRWLG
ncbi:acyltransferase [Streptomyces millisiae]|uniref:Acyltransferase n=1 Tax=Streptomyces millisiae TaxID=3075542 RepID=A0ABU2LS25_9ACTN|nr:acyltransferase [Streptomyces sp. DSM 44918]MDT0320393.1 acyltransferase [Streptomyces sp. DSM 44918]